MSAEFLPLRPSAGPPAVPAPAAGSTGAAASGSAKGAEAARLAKASKDFQAIFLMEMMKPMTEELSADPLSTQNGSNSDTYSWFWNEALASKLAGSWPLPSMTGIDPATAAAAAQVGSSGLRSPSLRGQVAVSGSSPGGATPVRSIGTAGDAAASAAAGAAPASPSTGSGTGGVPAASPIGTHDTLLTRAGRLFKLPLNLLRAVVMVESGGKESAVSSRGAVGLMQLMPDTAREMGIRDRQDPWQNLYAGAKYLSRQVARFDSLEEAVAAYNAGPGAVEAHQGVPPFPETRTYVQRVLDTKARLDLLYPQDG